MRSKTYPILYSFRRCPYAMRARLALKISKLKIELRDILLKDKPQYMLELSQKGTVPVLLLPDGTVIDESFDIMLWALKENDPYNWLPENSLEWDKTNELIKFNDNEFKENLDRYKYADRFPEKSVDEYRQQAEIFLQILEKKLHTTQYLIADTIKLVDIAVLPFIRQFAYVDKNRFDLSEYKKLQVWLSELTESCLFNSVMQKTPLWSTENKNKHFL